MIQFVIGLIVGALGHKFILPRLTAAYAWAKGKIQAR